MNELELKYGCNPNQKPSRIYMKDGSDLPIKVLMGRPGYINFLDAFNGWQLVSELKKATGLPAATSFKHVSPAGAAVGLPLDETLAKIYWVDDLGELSPLASAYARARGADRMSSFGDFIALSDVCDVDTARLIKREVSDGVIAPGYEPEALEILAQKKKGNYNVIQIDENYVPEPLEHKQVFGVTFEQGRQELAIDDALISNIVTENKAFEIVEVGNNKIFATHGHDYGVDYNIDTLCSVAESNGCNIAMYGHTHVPDNSIYKGMYVVNPGSVSRPRQLNRKPTYGVMKVDAEGKTDIRIQYV